jgi:hypothetical protein
MKHKKEKTEMIAQAQDSNPDLAASFGGILVSPRESVTVTLLYPWTLQDLTCRYYSSLRRLRRTLTFCGIFRNDDCDSDSASLD